MQALQLVTRPNASVTIVRGSVVDMHVDAIVNAANESLLGGGGVDGAIHAAAGPALLKECRGIGGCPTGEARLTGAYGIENARHIIHAVGPVYHGRPEDARLLAGCYTASLDLALLAGDTSIAFPCISCGVYGYPVRDASAVALATVLHWLDQHPDATMEIYLVCFRDVEFDAFRAIAEG